VHRRHSGDWVTRLTSDVSSVSGGLSEVVPEMIALGVRFAAALAYLVVLDPVMGAVALGAGLLLLLPGRLFSGRLFRISGESRECEGRIRGFLQETLRRNTVVKAFGLESRFSALLSGLHGESLRLASRQAWVSAAPGAGLTLGYWSGYLLAMTVGAIRLHAGQATFGMLTAFLQLVGQVQMPFQGLTRSLSRLIAMQASLDRLMVVEGLPVEWQDERAAPPLRRTGRPGEAGCRGVDLEFRDVVFSYDRKPVLNGVTFTIRAGEKVALAGDSGNGKTTIVRLLLGLIEPESGEVRIREPGPGGGGHRPSRAARRYFSYAPQGNSLVSGTVRDNVLHGRPEELARAGEAAMLRCAGVAQLLAPIPGGLDTRMGENGDGLSEGQAQRIALARALVREAPVLLLDEATSALDLPAEEMVLKQVRSLGEDRTVIMVSHRAEVWAACDRVLCVTGGRVVEMEPTRENIG
jgi:ABC-type multidrug transport system fused ATPase/permease subunit